MTQDIKEANFEQALKKLESIVEKLESGDLSLDDALKQYEEGVKMADFCSKRLSEAQKRVEVLLKTTGGKFKTETFEDGDLESASKGKKAKK